MEAQIIETNQFPRFLMWVVGSAVILFCVAVFAIIMDWFPISMMHGLGIIAAAALGGLLGSQIGGRRDNDIALVVGAEGGTEAVNQIQKSLQLTQSHDITLLFTDGTVSVVKDENPLTWRSGVRVKIIHSGIAAKLAHASTRPANFDNAQASG